MKALYVHTNNVGKITHAKYENPPSHILEVYYSECEWENGDHIAIKGET